MKMEEIPTVVEFPLRGEWQNVRSPGHHRFAFDFAAVVDGRNQTRSFWRHLFGRVSVHDWYGWSQPVLAPLDGTVVVARDGWPDREELNLIKDVVKAFIFRPKIVRGDIRPFAGNHVLIQSEIVAFLAHLRCGSLRVREGQKVRKGEVIGEIGNSGNTLAPHLHFQLMDGVNPLKANIISFRVRRYERWDGKSWETVQNGVLRKGERIRVLPNDVNI